MGLLPPLHSPSLLLRHLCVHTGCAEVVFAQGAWWVRGGLRLRGGTSKNPAQSWHLGPVTLATSRKIQERENISKDIPDGSVVKTLPSNARGASLIPGRGDRIPCAERAGGASPYYKRPLVISGSPEWALHMWVSMWLLLPGTTAGDLLGVSSVSLPPPAYSQWVFLFPPMLKTPKSSRSQCCFMFCFNTRTSIWVPAYSDSC